MKSLLVKMPAEAAFDSLPEDISHLILSMDARYTVVGREFEGEKILDIVLNDDFDEAMLGLVPGWTLMGAWQWNGVPYQPPYINGDGEEVPENDVIKVLYSVDPSLFDFYPDVITSWNADGTPATWGRPMAMTEIHKWGGWPPRKAS